MEQAIEFHAEIGEDHILQVPADVPAGRVKVIVIVKTRPDRAAPVDLAAARRAAMGMDEASGTTIPEDFDAPLPPDVQRYFEGDDDEEHGLPR